ncbi:replication protein RepA [Roseomonas sp. BN140053]|uniref:replication protein RepA n=1 Tax=Roseomonas sp. BN140053 TaxID=3391898 RepID=UPI0039ECC9B5
MTLSRDSSPAPAGQQDLDILWHHPAFCRLALPLRAPAENAWSRDAGAVGIAMGPTGGEHPLPAGRSLRLLLLHILTAARRGASAVAEIGAGVEAVAANLGLEPTAARLRDLREQFDRLTASRLGVAEGRHPALPVLDARSGRNRSAASPWSPVLRLNQRFFATLQRDAVPLNRRVVAALEASATALDAYAWLAWAQEQARPDQPLLVSWNALQQQFGTSSQSPAQFRAAFANSLGQVRDAWPEVVFTGGAEGVEVHATAGAAACDARPEPARPAEAAPEAPSPPSLPLDAPEPARVHSPDPEAPVPAPRLPEPLLAGKPLPVSIAAESVPVAAPLPAPITPPPATAPQVAPPRPMACPDAVAAPMQGNPALTPQPGRPAPPQHRGADERAASPKFRPPREQRRNNKLRLPPNLTGLPCAIWLKRQENEESLTIEVTPGAEYDPHSRSLLAVEPIVQQVVGHLYPEELDWVASWIVINADLIQDYWDSSLASDEELMRQVRRLPTSRW